MFKKIFNFLRRYQEEKRIKQAELKRRKWYDLRYELIKFYEDKQGADGKADIPPFMLADKKMKEIIKTDKDLDFYYKKLVRYKRQK